MELKRILLIEENRQRLVRFLLRLGAYDVTITHCLEEALNWLQLTALESPYDLIVIDPDPANPRPELATAIAALDRIPVMLLARDQTYNAPTLLPGHAGALMLCSAESLLEEMETFFFRQQMAQGDRTPAAANRACFGHRP